MKKRYRVKINFKPTMERMEKKKDMTLEEKYDYLREYIKDLGSVAVAFSSGVDSTLLLKVASDVLGEKCIALTGTSASFPRTEEEESDDFCKQQNIKQIMFPSNELESEDYAKNPKDRCYHCKHILFSNMLRLAKENGAEYVLEGSNVDDLGDYRPGLRAIEELGVKSPLREAGLTKEEIRTLSKRLNLPTYKKQSFACLASRIPYGERITKEKLHQIEKAEQFLKEEGFLNYRVRVQEKLARIEVAPEDISRFLEDSLREKTVKYLKSLGFLYVTVDLQGYRTGSMNEVLK